MYSLADLEKMELHVKSIRVPCWRPFYVVIQISEHIFFKER
jgi:hypothetical protein